MKNIFILLTVLSISCSNPFYYETGEDIDSLESRTFNYEMTVDVYVNIKTGYSNVPIDLYYAEIKRGTLVSDESGEIKTTMNFPKYITQIELKSTYIGIANSVFVKIVNSEINFSYMEEKVTTSATTPLFSRGNGNGNNNSSQYNTLGNWNSNGVPDYLLESENLSTEFLNVLNSILPEYQPVPEYNPQYLENSAVTDIHITEEAEVFITFIHEGAGYKNSLGFFTYDTVSGPPQSVNKSDITLIFPNVSFVNSGGGLTSGNRVKLGTFSPGTSIGWVLIADGYSLSTSSVGDGRNKFYSVDSLNPESQEYNQHVVQIAFEDRIVFSFEDLLRPDGDNDFNDGIFSADSTPITAISRENIVEPEESPTIDSDGDGVIDTQDYEPNNSQVTSAEFYPGQGQNGSIAYEDLWPYKGDYDFNDLVIDLNFTERTNSNNKIVSITGVFTVKGILASMRNGFAIELGTLPEKVASVSGGEFSKGYIIRQSNGVEERQSKAVIGIFEDANLHYNNGIGQELTVTVNFTQPVTREELGYPPYNPFVISNGERGREVHLPGKPSTDLAHIEYFLSEDDNSTFENSNSYKTDTNHPWALHIPANFRYPIDDVDINTVYNHFETWVNSEGELYNDWFLDKESYINYNLLFN